MINIIDPHLHLFDLEKGDYAWLHNDKVSFNFDKKIIQKSFTENDLQLTSPLNLTGFVHIEAGFNNQQPWQEVAWLEEHCQLPFRTIAFIDITLNEVSFASQLQQLLRFKSLVGIRHILDDEAEIILSDKNCQTNLELLAQHQLLVEVQMPLANNHAVQRLIDIIEAIPALSIIINHAGWPENVGYKNSDWQENLKRLSTVKQCAIKCSGWEMMTNSQTKEQVLDHTAAQSNRFQQQIQVLNSCLEHFGDNRVMLASNFPLSLADQSYQTLWQNYQTLPLSPVLFTKLCYSNAYTWYKF